MTVFEKIKNKNIDELAEWLAEHCLCDTAPWWDFWNENYCKKCKPIKRNNGRMEYAYCELNHNCKFFKEMEVVPDIKQMIKMWLESELN